MPLIHSKSKKAVGENIKKEMDAGKPHKQSIAIALSVQRQAKKKKMAKGGNVTLEQSKKIPPKDMHDDPMGVETHYGERQSPASIVEEIMNRRRLKAMSRGGRVDAAEEDNEPMIPMRKPDDERPEEDEYMADHFADGGMVDLEEASEEMPNEYDKLNEMAADEEQYDDSQISPQPEDSNEHGDDIEKDTHDMVEEIRRKMAAKRKMMR